jgi:hypothetical protein
MAGSGTCSNCRIAKAIWPGTQKGGAGFSEMTRPAKTAAATAISNTSDPPQSRLDRIEFLRREQVDLVEEDRIGKGDLLDRLVAVIELRQ